MELLAAIRLPKSGMELDDRSNRAHCVGRSNWCSQLAYIHTSHGYFAQCAALQHGSRAFRTWRITFARRSCGDGAKSCGELEIPHEGQNTYRSGAFQLPIIHIRQWWLDRSLYRYSHYDRNIFHLVNALAICARIIASILVFFLGIELTLDALWDSSRNLMWSEWTTVLGTLCACNFIGFAPGSRIGLAIALVFQAVWSIVEAVSALMGRCCQDLIFDRNL